MGVNRFILYETFHRSNVLNWEKVSFFFSLFSCCNTTFHVCLIDLYVVDQDETPATNTTAKIISTAAHIHFVEVTFVFQIYGISVKKSFL